MKAYKKTVFLILFISIIIGTCANFNSSIQGSNPGKLGLISSVIFITTWIILTIVSSYKREKWFITFSIFYWALCLLIYIVGVNDASGSAFAIIISPFCYIPLGGITYLSPKNTSTLLCISMLIIIFTNIIAYFGVNKIKHKQYKI